jgi:hypothetical protein
MFAKKPKAPICPLLKGECIESNCLFWTHVRGRHPQTGAEIDAPDCAIRFLPVLILEGAKESRQTAAAVESFRNEVAAGNGPIVLRPLAHKMSTALTTSLLEKDGNV